MTAEGKLQSEIIKWLRSKGAYVVKNRAGPGVPVGCPDVLFLYEGAWGAIEVKATVRSPYGQGQKQTLARLAGWSSFVYVAHRDSWPHIKKELETLFF